MDLARRDNTGGMVINRVVRKEPGRLAPCSPLYYKIILRTLRGRRTI